MTKPNFFILGAPKCGTTALAAWLSDHKQVYFSPQKEPHHFNTDMAHRFFPDRDHYESLFSRARAHHTAVGEGSVWYLYSRVAVPAIEAYAEAPRYIVCLRNPVDMAYSLHEQLMFSGNEDVAQFEAAWRLLDARRQGLSLPRQATDDGSMVDYSSVCALGSQLARLYEVVPRERVHVVVMDDLRTDPRAVFDGVQRFLGLPVDPDIALPVVNAAKTRRVHGMQNALARVHRVKRALGLRARFGIVRWVNMRNRKQTPRPPLAAAFRAELTDHFAPEVALLERLLERDLSKWKSTGAHR